MKRKFLGFLGVVVSWIMVVLVPGISSAQTIKIGALLPMTGPYVEFGQDFKAGIELRLEEIGYKIAGKTVELIIEDDKSVDSATGMDKTKKMIEGDKIHVMLGPLMIGIRQAVEPYIERMKIPNIALSRHLSRAAKKDGWIFLQAGTVREFSRPMGWFAYEDMGFRKANVLANDNLAGREYIGGVLEGWKLKGGTVLQEQWTPLPTADYSPYVSALKKEGDVALTWLAARDTLNFLKSFYDFGLKDKMGVVVVLNGEFLRDEQMPEFGDNVQGITGITEYHWRLDNPRNKAFVKSIEAKTGKKPSPFTSRAYDCVSIAVAALEATQGDTNPETLRKAVSQVKLDTPSGALALDSRGIGIRDLYAVKVEKREGKNTWSVVKSYPKFSAD